MNPPVQAPERLILPVPYLQQPKWYFCGPACLSMLFMYYGIDHSVGEIARVAGTTEEVGTTHEGLLTAARHFGLSACEEYNASYAHITEALHRGEPVILYTHWPDDTEKKYGELDEMHYLLAVGYDHGHLVVHDPDYEDGEPNVWFPDWELFMRWRSERSADEYWMMTCERPRTESM